MGVKFNGLIEHPNTHSAGTLPTNGFIENKLITSTNSVSYSPGTGTNSCGCSVDSINLSANHISGQSYFEGNIYRVQFDFTWSGYTSGKAWYQGSVNDSWSSGSNWFTASARNTKEISALCAGASSGVYHYDFNVTIPSSTYNQNKFAFHIRSDSANEGTYYKISNFKVYSYNGGIDKDKMSFNHFYEW